MEIDTFPTIKFSQNPFDILHSDVHELIFQHFKFNDVIKFSLVSQSFYNISAGSDVQMSKVNVLGEFLITLDQQNTNSKRVYQSISLSNRNQISSKKLVQLTKSLKN